MAKRSIEETMQKHADLMKLEAKSPRWLMDEGTATIRMWTMMAAVANFEKFSDFLKFHFQMADFEKFFPNLKRVFGNLTKFFSDFEK